MTTKKNSDNSNTIQNKQFILGSRLAIGLFFLWWIIFYTFIKLNNYEGFINIINTQETKEAFKFYIAIFVSLIFLWLSFTYFIRKNFKLNWKQCLASTLFSGLIALIIIFCIEWGLTSKVQGKVEQVAHMHKITNMKQLKKAITHNKNLKIHNLVFYKKNFFQGYHSKNIFQLIVLSNKKKQFVIKHGNKTTSKILKSIISRNIKNKNIQVDQKAQESWYLLSPFSNNPEIYGYFYLLKPVNFSSLKKIHKFHF